MSLQPDPQKSLIGGWDHWSQSVRRPRVHDWDTRAHARATFCGRVRACYWSESLKAQEKWIASSTPFLPRYLYRYSLLTLARARTRAYYASHPHHLTSAESAVPNSTAKWGCLDFTLLSQDQVNQFSMFQHYIAFSELFLCSKSFSYQSLTSSLPMPKFGYVPFPSFLKVYK